MKYKKGDKISYCRCVFLIKNTTETQYLLKFEEVIHPNPYSSDHLMFGWMNKEEVENKSELA